MRTHGPERDGGAVLEADAAEGRGPGRRSRVEGMVRRAAAPGAGGGALGAGQRDALSAAAGSGGIALPDGLRSRFESSLGSDLGAVRLHHGGSSAHAAASIGARAFAVGSDIHFGAGELDPGSERGQTLLAHEVAHTVQQGSATVQAKLEVSQPGDAAEVEADLAAGAMLAGQPANLSRAVVGVARMVQREAAAAPAAAPAQAAPAAAPAQAAPVGKVTTKTGVCVRQAPDGDATVLATLDPATSTDVFALSGSWLQIRHGGALTYITGSTRYVDYQPLPAPAAPAVSPPAGGETSTEESDSSLASQLMSGAMGVVESIGGAIQSGIDTVSSFFGGSAPAPAQTVPAPPTPAEEPKLEEEARRIDPFFSQRDNLTGKESGESIGSNQGRVIPDKECNVTTLAMQLVALAGDSATVNAETMRLLTEANQTTSPDMLEAQPEDLILELFIAWGNAYWAEVCPAHPELFPKMDTNVTFYQWYSDPGRTGYGWHQIGQCLNWVGKLYSFVGAGGGYDEKKADSAGVDGVDPTTQKYYLETLKPKLDGGAAIMISTAMSGGHIVSLIGIEPDGIRINDPYGVKIGGPAGDSSGYVRNAETSPQSKAQHFVTYADNIPRRFSHHPALLEIANDTTRRAQPQPNWGENNFYSYDEVRFWDMGKWNSVLEGK